MLPELQCYADVAYSSLATIQNTYDLTASVIRDGVAGELVECGVAAGAQIGVMGHACQQLGSTKRIYAFDSYQGIPLAGECDTEQPGVGVLDPNRPIPYDARELLVSSGITVHPLAQVQSALRRWGLDLSRYEFVEGWFQDTVPLNKIEKIALLRLDGDLYESTRVCLDCLHPKVQVGGYVIIDDYGTLVGARRAVREYFEEHGLKFAIVPVDPVRKEVYWYQVGAA